MKTLRTVAALLLWGCATAMAAGAGDAVVIRSLRYSTEGGTGKLLIGTDGIPVVITGGSNDLVTLAFRHATVSSPPGAAHVFFKEGPMRSAVIDRSASDSVTVTIRLRTQGRVDFGLEGHDVVLRVTPHGSMAERPPRPFAPVTALLSSELKSKPGDAAVASIGAHTALTAGAIIPPVGFLTILGLCVFAALTSFAFSLAVVRRLDGKTLAVELQPEEQTEELPYDDGEPEAPLAVLPSPFGEEEESEDEIDARAYQLAKALRRGKGEMDLALRMEGKREAVLGEKISKTCRSPKTKAQRVQNAKRLGVGRGEIDLALRLKKMVPVSNTVEEP